ncbi:hypothetical protein LXA43DRAFT_540985 [Ganoderma leucocontextum]|nr:hypothetical protein LXA43DRAFT_540985 [Ganoderma leucocontextum]
MTLHPLYALSSTPRIPDIRRLPEDLLFLIFSMLHGQDIARCIMVCRCFEDVVHINLHLQYRIELAKNGMVDGHSSSLAVSERLQRLRQYSSNFRNGIFDYEDLSGHTQHILQLINLRQNGMKLKYVEGSSLALYSKRNLSCLSIFKHGSAQAGIPSSRWIMPVGSQGDPSRSFRLWDIDIAQDLLVTAELVGLPSPAWMSRLAEVRFCSFSRSKTIRTDHPAAKLPCIQVFPPAGSDQTVKIRIFGLWINTHHVIWGLATHGTACSYSLEVCNWRTGQVISRIDVGTQSVPDVIRLDSSRLLVTRKPPESPYLHIYSISPSAPNRPMCTLQLPGLNSGERLMGYKISSSLRPPALEGHFRADPLLSILVLTCRIRGPEGEYITHLLIPSTTLLAQVDAALDSPDSREHPDTPPVPVPWKDWGPHGCLRLHVHLASGHVPDDIALIPSLIPSGSRMPLVWFEDPNVKRASVYVFEINPLAARHARLLAARSDGSQATAVVGDVEAALPGVVDPECSAIPYVVYRFRLPYSPLERHHWHRIRSVDMSMTGFTVRVSVWSLL